MEPFTPHELVLIADLVAWALDQDHDAVGFGDPEYLSFLVDGEATEEELDALRARLNSILAKAVGKETP